MYLEGLGLLAITVPILLVFVFNMAFLDKLDSYREPLSILRFLVTLSVSYLLMAGMICMGIWFPVRKAVKMAPAEAIGRLSEKHRLVIVLYYYNEMSVQEIAKITGCLPGTVKSRLHFARKQLKKLLSDTEEESTGRVAYERG